MSPQMMQASTLLCFTVLLTSVLPDRIRTGVPSGGATCSRSAGLDPYSLQYPRPLDDRQNFTGDRYTLPWAYGSCQTCDLTMLTSMFSMRATSSTSLNIAMASLMSLMSSGLMVCVRFGAALVAARSSSFAASLGMYACLLMRAKSL